MKTLHTSLLIAAVAFAPTLKAAEPDTSYIDIPSRAIVLTGGENGLQEQVYTVLYSTSELVHFHDPVPPRFLLIDREGRTVFGVGGYVEGVVGYDFMGAIDSNGFDADMISVPSNPAERNQFHASISHTNIYMVLATQTKWGVLSAYAQADFSGENSGFKLKHAVVKLHNVLGGLTRTTFQDATSTTPTIDYSGATGSVDLRNIQLRYSRSVNPHFAFAIAAEMPQTSYTTSAYSKSINQRIPDIPAYIQYNWNGSKSHVRLSGLWRNLSYRDLREGDNHFVTGWAVQLSGAVNVLNHATVYYQGSYGQGYGDYIVGTNDQGFDLIPDGYDGKMKAPHQFGVTAGLKVNLTKNVFVSGAYSTNRVYDQHSLGGNTLRNTDYIVANCFYTPIEDLQVGVEYLHGRRVNVDRESATANRIQAMIRYNF